MAEHSRLVLCRPHRWHVQEAGAGDTILLIHGAGGATQSWRGLFPLLTDTHHVVAVDLPGQGFTQNGARARCGLDHVATDLWALCRAEGWHPAAIVGHSAGAAVALRMTELPDGPKCPVIGINAALAKFKGMAGWLFPMLAKALSLSPVTAGLFAATTTEASVRNLLKGTGSRIDDAGVALYRRLASDTGHVDGTLAMMSQWRLDGLLSRLPRIAVPVTLIVGLNDAAVPPGTAREAAALVPGARLVELPGLGHLAHEEDPTTIARLIHEALSPKADRGPAAQS